MYPPIHNTPTSLIPQDFVRLDFLWEKYPRYREMRPSFTLEELLEEHESYRQDLDEALAEEYAAEHMERFLVPLAWTDLAYRQATRQLIEADEAGAGMASADAAGADEAGTGMARADAAKYGCARPDNMYVRWFMEQFDGWNTDRKAYFLFPESCISQFFVIMEVCRRAEEVRTIRNLFPDEEKVHFLAVFDKSRMEDVLLMFHLVYGSVQEEQPGGYSLYNYSLPWYLTHLQEQGVVLRSPYLPDRLAKYQGGLMSHMNPVKTVYVRRNVRHMLEAGYIASELEFFRCLNEIVMPVFQWWYADLAQYEEKDGMKTSWRLERTKIRTRLTADGVIRPKWKHELTLFRVVRKLFPDTLYQYRPEWLGHQSLDIYIPSLEVGIEYQGIQHYTPVDFFGGEEALDHRRELDRQKAELCREHGVHLIEWPYQVEPTEENVRARVDLVTEGV